MEQGVDFMEYLKGLIRPSERRIGKALKLTDKKVILASKKCQPKIRGCASGPGKKFVRTSSGLYRSVPVPFCEHSRGLPTCAPSRRKLDTLVKAKDEGIILTTAEKEEIDIIRRRYDKVRRCDYCQPCSEEIPRFCNSACAKRDQAHGKRGHSQRLLVTCPGCCS